MMMDWLSPGRGEMSSTLTRRRFGVNLAERSIDETSRRADLKHDEFPNYRPPFGKRASRAVARFLATFCIGVAASLAWLSYGDAAREMIASSSPQLAWLAPKAAAPQAAPSAAVPPDQQQQQLNAISLGLAAMRQSVDQLAAQLAAGQEQMTREITLWRAAQQDIINKISVTPLRPAAVQTQKPVPLTPAQQPTVR
jgi:hypothetical protein